MTSVFARHSIKSTYLSYGEALGSGSDNHLHLKYVTLGDALRDEQLENFLLVQPMCVNNGGSLKSAHNYTNGIQAVYKQYTSSIQVVYEQHINSVQSVGLFYTKMCRYLKSSQLFCGRIVVTIPEAPGEIRYTRIE